MDKIQSPEWEVFLNTLMTKHELKSATRNRVRALMSKMYNDALRQNVVARNPMSVLPKLKESMKTWDYWTTPEEAGKYLAAAQAEHCSIYLFACVALNTGLRLGEILALEWQDIDLRGRRLRVWRIFEDASGKVQERTKGFTERWLGINDSLFNAFESFKTQTKYLDPDSPLIHNSDGVRQNHSAMRRIHNRLCALADVKEIRIHDLRHTFASHYIMNGGSLTELQGLLGHTSPMMTLKYAHLAPGFLESRAKVVSFSVNENSQENTETPRTLRLVSNEK